MPRPIVSPPSQGWFTRLTSRHLLTFTCPACGRPIAIRKAEAGGSLSCPLCSAALVAPHPATASPVRICDAQYEAARQFQKQYGHPLIELKRGRFQSAVVRKQRRASQAPPSTPSAPSAPSALSAPPLPPRPSPEEPPRAARKPRPSAPPANRYPSLYQVRALPCVRDNPLVWDSEDRALSAALSPRLSPLLLAQIVCAAAVVLALLLFSVQESLEGRQGAAPITPTDPEESPQQEIAQAQARQSQAQKVNAAVIAANKALGAPSWKRLLLHVRHPERIAPVMQHYYANTPWRPRKIARIISADSKSIEGHEFLALETLDSQGRRLALGLEHTPNGWKLDWEQFVPLHELEWAHFVENRPREPQTLRVSAIRRTPTPEQLLLSGIPEDQAFGVMLWCTDIASGSQQAVLDKDSPLARKLAGIISVDQGRRMILTLSSVPTPNGLRHDLATIEEVVTLGWTYLDDRSLHLSAVPTITAP
jgi:hypothetical protein